jgi:hypothetical protein
VRLFVAEEAWSELTDGEGSTVRVAAADLQQARRERARIRAERADVAVILDLTVSVAPDFQEAFRAANRDLDLDAPTVHYAGTLDGLTGLIADIETADVADGVTLVAPRQDVRALGRDVLDRLADRAQRRAS